MPFTRLLRDKLEQTLSVDEKQAKINEVKKEVGPELSKFPTMSSDASILRFLRARNWHTKKASRMLKETVKWKMVYKPEKVKWEDIAVEAQTGKAYRADYLDKHGRAVLVLRPGFQNTKVVEGQIRYLVYCMENAILSLEPGQEQMVWLIDFQRWNMSSISVKVTQETARVLQNRYPERLGLAILYNPPKMFESFWAMVRPFLEHKTYKKVKFAYSDDPKSRKIMEDNFHIDKLEPAFGGKSKKGFNYEAYAERMKEEDKKMADFIRSGSPWPSDATSVALEPQSLATDTGSGSSDEDGSVAYTDTTMSELGGTLDDDDRYDEVKSPLNSSEEADQAVHIAHQQPDDSSKTRCD